MPSTGSGRVHAVGGAELFKDTALEDGVKRRNEGDIATVDDLVRLPFLHEPAIPRLEVEPSRFDLYERRRYIVSGEPLQAATGIIR